MVKVSQPIVLGYLGHQNRQFYMDLANLLKLVELL
jgi:hypothetical protein